MSRVIYAEGAGRGVKVLAIASLAVAVLSLGFFLVNVWNLDPEQKADSTTTFLSTLASSVGVVSLTVGLVAIESIRKRSISLSHDTLRVGAESIRIEQLVGPVLTSKEVPAELRGSAGYFTREPTKGRVLGGHRRKPIGQGTVVVGEDFNTKIIYTWRPHELAAALKGLVRDRHYPDGQ